METADIHAKNIKDRLDELKGLFDAGYVTEGEFKIARVNILSEGGFDVVTQHSNRAYFQEEEPKGMGCGCFLLTVLLAAFFVLGVVFFAASYWPERLGGSVVRDAREWFTEKSVGFIGGFFEALGDDNNVPDPVASADVTEKTEPEQPDDPAAVFGTPDTPAELSGDAPIVSLDLSIPERPAETPASAPAAAEAQAPVSAEPDAAPAVPSADLRAGTIRGVITATNVRIRSEPDTSTNGNIVGRGRPGDRFSVLEEGAAQDGSTWYHIMYEDGERQGWISGSLVRLER